ncbi:sensor box histidine kinase [Natronomonas pharaonis DSM 2160]|uniref:histidine kinase n=1 Tax=Natronomonas pharaonis (strain ATCC 35678 / DSM 2160 / CIP 103997 / JCM 8858 / NBRC 14720 / NCIMB 2260 / Gabara) TaxID=348780 RepID=A0A1U7EYU6_NATPD|nr:PAS domain S-box protein [Natronomonas pharaonis]CAI50439.1 sensor box histidine kinase [Natronomonas pharaonis DSM 2160]
MTDGGATPEDRYPQPPALDDVDATVQVLVVDDGNRRIIRDMLADHVTVVSGETVTDADLYLVEDRLLERYRHALSDAMDDQHPVFCPIVLIQSRGSEAGVPASHDGGAVLIDEVISAPIDRTELVRRIQSLLVRRQQSLELSESVTTLREREQTLRRFERAIRQTDNAVAITAADGTIEMANPALEELTGYSETALVGRQIGALEPGDSHITFDDAFWETVQSRATWDGEVTIEHADGDRRITDTTVATIADGDRAENHGPADDGFVIVCNDITDRVTQEELLQQRESQLGLLREILTRILRHNIRNDLTVIEGNAKLLAERASDPEDSDLAETIAETAGRLHEISETARKYSNLVGKEPETAAAFEYDLAELIPELATDLESAYPEITVEWEAPDTCPVVATDSLRVALEELLENAAEHNTAPDPTISIRVHAAEDIRIIIEDNGPGLPETEVAALEQGQETPLVHSVGVGLWLSKWAIEAVGGTLSFDTGESGTKAIIELRTPARVSGVEYTVSTPREREQRLKRLVGRMTDGVVEVGADWQITYIDDQAEPLLEWDAADVRDCDLRSVFPDSRETSVIEQYRTAMEDRSAESFEAYFPALGRWLEVYVYPDFEGGLSVYLRDVTDRRAYEQELTARTRQLRGVLDSVDAAIWLRDPESNFLLVNQQLRDLFGIPAERDIVGKPLDIVLPDDVAAQFRSNDRRAWEAEATIESEETVATEAGERAYLTHITPLYDDTGEPYATCGIATDITGQKQTETDLRERVRELDALHRTAELFAATEASTKSVLESLVFDIPTWFQHPDRTEARLVYDDIEVTTDGYEPLDDQLSVSMTTDWDAELAMTVGYRADDHADANDPFLAEERALLDSVLSFMHEHLGHRRSRRLYQTIAEQFPSGGVFLYDSDLRYQIARGRGFEWADVGPESLEGSRVEDIFDGETKARLVDLYESALDGEERSIEMEYFGRTHQVRAAPVRDADGRIRYGVSTTEDITEQKAQQAELAATNRRLQIALTATETGIWQWNVATDEVYWDDTVERLLGLSPGSFEGTIEAFEQRVHPDDRERLQTEIDRVLDRGGRFETEFRMYHEDGDPRWVAVRGKVTEQNDSTWVVGAHTDITERKEYERQLEAQRDNLELLNEMLRHDIRNDLNVISGYADLLSEAVDGTAQDDIETVRQKAEEAIGLTKTARDLAAAMLDAHPEQQSLPLAQPLEEQIEEIRTGNEEANITVERPLPEAVVEADEMLAAVFRNLLQNAIQHADTDSPDVVVTVEAADDTVQVRIADTGPGIPDAQKDDIFAKGKKSAKSAGTGIGLYLVETLVERYGGAVWVEDNEPRGAVFVVELPKAR